MGDRRPGWFLVVDEDDIRVDFCPWCGVDADELQADPR